MRPELEQERFRTLGSVPDRAYNPRLWQSETHRRGKSKIVNARAGHPNRAILVLNQRRCLCERHRLHGVLIIHELKKFVLFHFRHVAPLSVANGFQLLTGPPHHLA